MDLDLYNKKRDFSHTSEPRGTARETGRGDSFVIQKHAATRLHYDFRLELHGVLKSWAVPKGPSQDPSEKRLAVEVEDHPLDYGGFEGTIPAGQYGGGTVVLWDRGRWEPDSDPRKGYEKGRLKFTLHGEKLHGGFTLVRMGGRAAEEGRANWLLIKEKDEYARPLAEGDILEERPESVATGRDLAGVAAADPPAPARPAKPGKSSGRRGGKTKRAPQKLLSPGSRGRARRAAAPRRSRSRSRSPVDPSELAGARATDFPEEVEPQLATLVTEPPTDDRWVYEMKLDGYRMLAMLDPDVELRTRRGQNWTERFPTLCRELAKLPVRNAVLDGELVAMRPDGVTDFQDLQSALREGEEARLIYFAFDLLHLDGHDLRGCAQEVRKGALAALLAGSPKDGVVRYTEHLEGDGAAVFKHASQLGLEGIIAKERDAAYKGGRVGRWLKVKCGHRQEFVIVGFTDPNGSRTGLGAILVGVHKDGELVYAGKVGTGFSRKALKDLRLRLNMLERKQPSVAHAPRIPGARWVEPKLVAEVRFANWTRDGLLRHPSFEGLREDRPSESVVRETPRPPPAPEATAARKKGRDRQAEGKSGRDQRAEGRSGRDQHVEVAGVHLTHPDKVLYPEQSITKVDLARYYAQVAERMLPHAARRLLTLVRCPSGQGKPCFYQKHEAEGLSDEIKQIMISEKGDGSGEQDGEKGKAAYFYVDSTAGLVSLVQRGALEIHIWGSHVDRIEQPDLLVFDLDPAPDVPWARTVEAAKTVRTLLETLELQSFVKTTGGKGLHVVVPIQRKREWDEIKPFTKAVADTLVRFNPKRYVTTITKAKRTGKILIDVLRNGRGATAVAPYSTRARPGAPVATPISWEELDGPLDPAAFTIETVPRRIATLDDPWAELPSVRQSITSAMMKRVGL